MNGNIGCSTIYPFWHPEPCLSSEGPAQLLLYMSKKNKQCLHLIYQVTLKDIDVENVGGNQILFLSLKLSAQLFCSL